MPSATMKGIQAYTDRIYGIGLPDRIFPFTENLIRRNITRGAEKAGIPRIRIHNLRHSHVSLLIELGFSPHLIAERIGDTVQMVNSTYGHLYPSRHEVVAKRLDQLIVPRWYKRGFSIAETPRFCSVPIMISRSSTDTIRRTSRA